jgi:nitrate/nitrite transporter NarK
MTIFLWALPNALSAMRVFVGIGQGAHFPCMYDFSSAWFPKEKKQNCSQSLVREEISE